MSVVETRTAAVSETRLWAGLRGRPIVGTISLVAAGIGILTAGAWLSVPFYPVPLTLQTLAVLLVGGLLGPRLGSTAVLGYLALGMAGAPVFHGGLGGPAVLLGPTGGYLAGFLPAAFLMGVAASQGRRSAVGQGRRITVGGVAWLVAGALLAEVVIYVAGVPWLAAVYTGGSLRAAVMMGAVPYLLGDLLKAAVAIAALSLNWAARGPRGLLPF